MDEQVIAWGFGLMVGVLCLWLFSIWQRGENRKFLSSMSRWRPPPLLKSQLNALRDGMRAELAVQKAEAEADKSRESERRIEAEKRCLELERLLDEALGAREVLEQKHEELEVKYRALVSEVREKDRHQVSQNRMNRDLREQHAHDLARLDSLGNEVDRLRREREELSEQLEVAERLLEKNAQAFEIQKRQVVALKRELAERAKIPAPQKARQSRSRKVIRADKQTETVARNHQP